MPDRFHNGNPNNDNGDPSRPISFRGLDKTSKWAFHGGDIQDGVFGHHGWWIIDFTEIDPHFGTNEDLRSLIDAAHARGIKVFFDIITNHTTDVIKYKECHNLDGTFAGLDDLKTSDPAVVKGMT
jgi:glycosidase